MASTHYTDFKNSAATVKGHIDQVIKYIRSTNPIDEEDTEETEINKNREITNLDIHV